MSDGFPSLVLDPLSGSKEPHGWIQWKGTIVCADILCPCGAHGHIDSDFAYYIRCGGCGKLYEASGFFRLYEVPDSAGKHGCGFVDAATGDRVKP